MPRGSVDSLPARKFFVQIAWSQVFAIGLSPLLSLQAQAQTVGLPASGGDYLGSKIPAGLSASERMLVQNAPNITAPHSTILPTDVMPLPAAQERMSIGENFQLRLLQSLPSRFYFSGSCETSFRYETNPFQFPTKRKFLTQLPSPNTIRQLNYFQQGQINDLIGLVNDADGIFRVLPNVSGGWTLTPSTRLFANYFAIRDSLFHHIRLNTVIHSYAGGIQQDFRLGDRANLQAEFQFRELNQMHQQSVFDFLPGLTCSYILNPKTVLFANALIQLRGKKYFQAPVKELDPFYTFGGLFQKSGWTFSASATFVQNFRNQFKHNAQIPVNNYVLIADFEIARRLFKQIPGLQAFVRAEPIWNGHSHNRPGLAGVDFRLFYGMRMALAKPALTATIEQIREQLKEQETAPQRLQPGSKPSAYLEPYQLISANPQPIHGYSGENGGAGQGQYLTPDIASCQGAECATPTDELPGALSDAQRQIADSGDSPAGTSDQILNLSQATADWSTLEEAAEKAVTSSSDASSALASLIEKSAALSTSGSYCDTAGRTKQLVQSTPALKAPAVLVAQAPRATPSPSVLFTTGSARVSLPAPEVKLLDLSAGRIDWSGLEAAALAAGRYQAADSRALSGVVERAQSQSTLTAYAATAGRTRQLAPGLIPSTPLVAQGDLPATSPTPTDKSAKQESDRPALCHGEAQPIQMRIFAEMKPAGSSLSGVSHAAIASVPRAVPATPVSETSLSKILDLSCSAIDWSGLETACVSASRYVAPFSQMVSVLAERAQASSSSIAYGETATRTTRLASAARRLFVPGVASAPPQAKPFARGTEPVLESSRAQIVDLAGSDFTQLEFAARSGMGPAASRSSDIAEITERATAGSTQALYTLTAGRADTLAARKPDNQPLVAATPAVVVAPFAVKRPAVASASSPAVAVVPRTEAVVAPAPVKPQTTLISLGEARVDWMGLEAAAVRAANWAIPGHLDLSQLIEAAAVRSSSQAYRQTAERCQKLAVQLPPAPVPKATATPVVASSPVTAMAKPQTVACVSPVPVVAPFAVKRPAVASASSAAVVVVPRTEAVVAPAPVKPQTTLISLGEARVDWTGLEAAAVRAANWAIPGHLDLSRLIDAAAEQTSATAYMLTAQRTGKLVSHINQAPQQLAARPAKEMVGDRQARPSETKDAGIAPLIELGDAKISWSELTDLSLKNIDLSAHYLGGIHQIIDAGVMESARMSAIALARRPLPVRNSAPGAARGTSATQRVLTMYAQRKENPSSGNAGQAADNGDSKSRANLERQSAQSTLVDSVAGDLDRLRQIELDRAKKERERKLLAERSRSKPTATTMEMRIVPPLPVVQMDGKQNPFRDSGLDLKAPLMLNVVR